MTEGLEKKEPGLGSHSACPSEPSQSSSSPLSSANASQDAQAQGSEKLETLGKAIHSSLAVLKERSKSLTEELKEQKDIAGEYKTKLSDLTGSLDNTNKRLYDYETKLIGYEQKLKSRAKIILAAAIIILINILGKIAAIVLRFKGIKLPEVFNILW